MIKTRVDAVMLPIADGLTIARKHLSGTGAKGGSDGSTVLA
jgi:hypothetical protein